MNYDVNRNGYWFSKEQLEEHDKQIRADAIDIDMAKPMHFTDEQSAWIKKYICLNAERQRADAIEECADKFADILSNVPNLCGRGCPVSCNWGTEESCKDMCKQWFLEQLKEQNE